MIGRGGGVIWERTSSSAKGFRGFEIDDSRQRRILGEDLAEEFWRGEVNPRKILGEVFYGRVLHPVRITDLI